MADKSGEPGGSVGEATGEIAGAIHVDNQFQSGFAYGSSYVAITGRPPRIEHDGINAELLPPCGRGEVGKFRTDLTSYKADYIGEIMEGDIL